MEPISEQWLRKDVPAETNTQQYKNGVFDVVRA
jgi:hypothetical protein